MAIFEEHAPTCCETRSGRYTVSALRIAHSERAAGLSQHLAEQLPAEPERARRMKEAFPHPAFQRELTSCRRDAGNRTSRRIRDRENARMSTHACAQTSAHRCRRRLSGMPAAGRKALRRGATTASYPIPGGGRFASGIDEIEQAAVLFVPAALQRIIDHLQRRRNQRYRLRA